MKRPAMITVLCMLASVLVFVALSTDTMAEVKNHAIQLRPDTYDQERLYFGQDLSPVNAQTVKRYRLAAQRGNAPAQFKLALLYDTGQGVPQDYAEAAKWLRKAAEQGLVEAQYNLGSMYDSGQGVPQDYTEAFKWLYKAAEQGYPSAQKNLGAKYGLGQGVSQNHTDAYVWSSLAVLSGNESAINNRDFAASQLSSEDLSVAQKRVNKYLGSPITH